MPIGCEGMIPHEKYANSMQADKTLPPDLAEIVEAWDALPGTVKTGILAIVKAVNGK